jgi:hypothetical protein
MRFNKTKDSRAGRVSIGGLETQFTFAVFVSPLGVSSDIRDLAGTAEFNTEPTAYSPSSDSFPHPLVARSNKTPAIVHHLTDIVQLHTVFQRTYFSEVRRTVDWFKEIGNVFEPLRVLAKR